MSIYGFCMTPVMIIKLASKFPCLAFDFLFFVSHLRFFICCHGKRNGIKRCVSGLKAKIEPCQTQQG